jgi:AAA+ ATPase superfamily predicted ATPase
MQDELIIALDEEIGNPQNFIGRKNELAYFLNWCENVKERQSQSTAILARRKKGKTALVQRLYNILYTKNDPQLIPFYFRIEEGNMTLLDYSGLFYRSLIGQYLGHKTRNVQLIRKQASFDFLLEQAAADRIIQDDIIQMRQIVQNEKPGEAWEFARAAGHRISGLKDERIIQILDEFQFLNAYIYTDETYEKKMELVPFYHRTAESKISPQIVTGSYIGWLTSIIRKMVSRYREYYLESFPEEEALDAVYNYSTLLKQPVTDETVPLIAEVCHHDPYYIAQVMRSNYEHKDLTDPESALEHCSTKPRFPGDKSPKCGWNISGKPLIKSMTGTPRLLCSIWPNTAVKKGPGNKS